MVCRATTGIAPDIGASVPDDGLTALCARTGQLWRCNDTENEPWVNRDSCRKMGVRSIVVAPVLALRKVIGILEVFSPSTAAFDDDKAATVQLMASAIALASMRNSNHALESAPGRE
jgi:putative methionine-R-sulfoxide reductase with GAF domain